MFLLLAQAAATVSQTPPIDWQGWLQLGFAATVALYLLVYDGPRQRDKADQMIKEMQGRYEGSLKVVMDDFKTTLREERDSRKEEMRLIREAFSCKGG